MKKILQWMLICIPMISFANSEKGTGVIKGKVTTNDEQSAADVTVIIKATNKGTVTDENGAFEFRKLTAGTYTLQISLMGYETTEQSVNVEENETTTLSLQLKLSDKQLKEVIVTSGKNRFAKKESEYIARMPLKNLENPQVYNVVTKELLQEQLETDFRGAMKNIPGVSQTAVANNGSSLCKKKSIRFRPYQWQSLKKADA